MNLIDSKNIIDLLDENEYKKLYNFRYEHIEIVRKRRPFNYKTGYRSTSFQKASLEIEYPVPLLTPIEDIIEIYGYINNKKYLIFRTDWSKNNIEKLKNIIVLYNNYDKRNTSIFTKNL